MSTASPPTAEEIREYVIWFTSKVTIQGYVKLASYITYLSYYFEIMDDEVSVIWPEPWRLGKILFLMTRYSVFARIILELFGAFPSELPISLKSCEVVNIVGNAFGIVQTFSAVASILLCLYALLGAKKKWLFAIFAPYFCSFTVHIVGITLHFTSGSAVRSPYLPETFKCTFTSGDPKGFTMSAYNILVRDGLTALFGVLTFYKRYRDQNNSLIRVMRRDGAVLYIAACLMGMLVAIFYTPGFPVQDEYFVLGSLRSTAYPILANQLILNMHRTATRNDLKADTQIDQDREL
ncbi:hypothetical protein EST38_g12052 [Candolleomyces aberdarensis]|uniref:DUF6533 domain-containing protein n=1 Tax=Candolleomyces aberdarensis TaxID=2316362 RepID=A0A4Q2D4W9_9AGAR|nr:hypothetical protein EST38_g12052 [Candolleomyces aberdarensis]